jgi:hypothetical protein
MEWSSLLAHYTLCWVCHLAHPHYGMEWSSLLAHYTLCWVCHLAHPHYGMEWSSPLISHYVDYVEFRVLQSLGELLFMVPITTE